MSHTVLFYFTFFLIYLIGRSMNIMTAFTSIAVLLVFYFKSAFAGCACNDCYESIFVPGCNSTYFKRGIYTLKLNSITTDNSSYYMAAGGGNFYNLKTRNSACNAAYHGDLNWSSVMFPQMSTGPVESDCFDSGVQHIDACATDGFSIVWINTNLVASETVLYNLTGSVVECPLVPSAAPLSYATPQPTPWHAHFSPAPTPMPSSSTPPQSAPQGSVPIEEILLALGGVVIITGIACILVFLNCKHEEKSSAVNGYALFENSESAVPGVVGVTPLSQPRPEFSCCRFTVAFILLLKGAALLHFFWGWATANSFFSAVFLDHFCDCRDLMWLAVAWFACETLYSLVAIHGECRPMHAHCCTSPRKAWQILLVLQVPFGVLGILFSASSMSASIDCHSEDAASLDACSDDYARSASGAAVLGLVVASCCLCVACAIKCSPPARYPPNLDILQPQSPNVIVQHVYHSEPAPRFNAAAVNSIPQSRTASANPLPALTPSTASTSGVQHADSSATS